MSQGPPPDLSRNVREVRDQLKGRYAATRADVDTPSGAGGDVRYSLTFHPDEVTPRDGEDQIVAYAKHAAGLMDELQDDFPDAELSASMDEEVLRVGVQLRDQS